MSQQAANPRKAIVAENLSVIYGERNVLDIPLLEVFSNEVFVIIGPNGSGKTTLLLCLTHLTHPQSGTVSYNGAPVLDGKDVLRLHRKTAVVFQESLLLNTTVWDNVTLGMKLRNINDDEMKARAQKWLERFGITPLAKRQARTLSSGEAKRASLARAFALQPEVLFLDEPFTALDSPTRQALLDDFEGVLNETKITTVMVTHDRNEALALADRVTVLMNGRVAQAGTPTEVFSSPVNEEIANFVEAGNTMRGVVTSQNSGLAAIQVGSQSIDAASNLATGTNVIVVLPYDDVTILVPSPEKACSSARNCLNGEVIRVFPIGSQVRVAVDCGFPITALVTRRSAEELGLEKGKQIQVSFKAVSTRVIKR
jgi:tungstate transport system ATP-binding protein